MLPETRKRVTKKLSFLLTFRHIYRSTFYAAEWLYDHLAGQIPVIMLTENEQVGLSDI